MRPIGVFDSGIGGWSVAKALERALPERDVYFVNDAEHIPYGNRRPGELFELVLPLLQYLERQNCELIVVACNTVSTSILNKLREVVKIPLVGIEPMIKPAATLTKSKIIAVCATPVTLASTRYKELKQQYAKGVKVLEPDCARWAAMVETNQVDVGELKQTIESVIAAGSDVIVLGCTHYHWIESIINQLAAGRAQIIQPEPAIVKRVQQLLKVVTSY